MTIRTNLADRARDRGHVDSFRSRKGTLDALIGQGLVSHEGADVGRDERLHAVAESSGDLSERHPSTQPCGRGGVAAVVDPQPWGADLREGPVPRSSPVRLPWTTARSCPENEVGRTKVVGLDPCA